MAEKRKLKHHTGTLLQRQQQQQQQQWSEKVESEVEIEKEREKKIFHDLLMKIDSFC